MASCLLSQGVAPVRAGQSTKQTSRPAASLPALRLSAPLRPSRPAGSLQQPSRPSVAVRAASITKLSVPADELMGTILLEQDQSNGQIFVKQVIEGSTAANEGVSEKQILKAVSDPAAPGNMWPVEARSSLRHVLDQFRLQQSGNVDLEFYPAGSPDAPTGRLGRDQEEKFATPKPEKAQRRQEQRDAYLSKQGTTNTTNWAAIAGGVFLGPAVVILGYAIASGYLDSLGASWRVGQ